MNIIIEISSAFLVLLSYLSLGKLFLNQINITKISLEIQLLTGAALYAFGVSLFGLIGGIGIFTGVMLVPSLLLFLIQGLRRKMQIELEVPSIWLGSFLGLNFLLVLYPSAYFDPLNYHLFGIVEWLKLDQLIHLKSAIQLMHTSFADYTYFPIGLIHGTNSIEQLLKLQVSAQIVTYGLGVCSFSLVLQRLLKMKLSHIWVSFIIIAMIARASLHHKGLMAKNDWIALSWFVAGLSLFYEKKDFEYRERVLGSFLLGMSVGSKFTYIPAVLIGIFALLPSKKLKIRELVLLAIICIAASLPYFFRNMLWTGNPIFPMGTRVFSTAFLGPSWIEGLNFFDMKLNEFNWELLLNKAHRIFTYEPITWFFLIIPFFYKKMKRDIFLTWLGVAGFLMLFIFVVGTHSEIRHFGPVALAINGFGAYSLWLCCQQMKLAERWQYTLCAGFFLVMLWNMTSLDQLNPVPSAVREGVFLPRYQSLINEKRGLVLAPALPEILPPDSKLALLDDTPPYYFSNFSIIRLWDDPEIDHDLNGCEEDLKCMLTQLDKWKITHLIDSETMFDPYYRPLVQFAIRDAVHRYPEIVSFKKNGENLISIKKLNDIIFQ